MLDLKFTQQVLRDDAPDSDFAEKIGRAIMSNDGFSQQVLGGALMLHLELAEENR
uniref:Uncharacterized protein n=1 Tax=viral metagenome TaxID=1070528 RepID=A0A6M3M0R4_9ZZZZ